MCTGQDPNTHVAADALVGHADDARARVDAEAADALIVVHDAVAHDAVLSPVQIHRLHSRLSDWVKRTR